jgi:hypothetical protein
MMNWRTTKPKARLQIEKRVGETDLHGLSHPCRLTAGFSSPVLGSHP